VLTCTARGANNEQTTAASHAFAARARSLPRADPQNLTHGRRTGAKSNRAETHLTCARADVAVSAQSIAL